MSRSCYSDDYGDEFPGQMDLFRGNVVRSLRSKAGQARLRELHAALLALPIKELDADIFAEGTRDHPRVCALGAWALHTCDGDPDAARALGGGRDADDHELADHLKPYGWPRLVVLEAVYANDFGDETWTRDTPAARYARVVRWVESQIRA